MLRGRIVVIPVLLLALVLGACGSAAGGGGGGSSSQKSKGYKIGWSDIYLTPTWMQETLQQLNQEVDHFKQDGTLKSFKVFNANGDTSQQIAQIQTMIDQKYDAILVDAGSSTALNPVLEKAVAQGIPVVNFDSRVTSPKVIRIGVSDHQWGVMLGNWMAQKLGGKGQVIAFNGPAGVAVAEDRWAGAQQALKQHPGIKVVANIHSEYNIAPARQAFAPVYASHSNIDGVLSLGGALSAAALQTIVKAGHKPVPITGENFNGFLKMWQKEKSNGFSSLSTLDPNYLSALSLDAAVRKLQGKSVPQNIDVPLPRITDQNLSKYVDPSKPDDYYPFQPLSASQKAQLLGG